MKLGYSCRRAETGQHIELTYLLKPDPECLDVRSLACYVLTQVNPEPEEVRTVERGILRRNWDYPGQCALFDEDGAEIQGYIEPFHISGAKGLAHVSRLQVAVGFERVRCHGEFFVDEETITIL